MAGQISSAVRGIFSANFFIARSTSTLTKTLPISKITAFRELEAMDYSLSGGGTAAAILECTTLRARNMLMIAGRMERKMTTAIT